MNDSLEIVEELESTKEPVNLAYDDETIVWEGRPSQWVNFGTFIFWTIAMIAVLVFMAVWNGGMNEGYSELIDTVVIATLWTVVVIAVLNIVLPYLQTHYEYTVITKNKIK